MPSNGSQPPNPSAGSALDNAVSVLSAFFEGITTAVGKLLFCTAASKATSVAFSCHLARISLALCGILWHLKS